MTQTRLCFEHPAELAPHDCPECQRPFCDACSVESILIESEFCSDRCRLSAEQRARAGGGASEQALLRGADRPIRMGWSVWWRAMPELAVYLLPLALLDGLLAAAASLEGVDPAVASFRLLPYLFGLPLVGVILSRAYIRFDSGNAYAWTLRRLVPWIITWAFVGIAIFTGFLLLIVPGIWATVRLFYADEFVLIHARSPGAAIRESLELTRGYGADVFLFQFMLGFAQYAILVPAFVGLVVFQSMFENALTNAHPVMQFVNAFITYYLLVLVAYASSHAPELAFFYGLRARVRVRGA